jgi:hypothetical protein
MKTHTAYLTFETTERRELIRITEEVQAAVDEAGIAEGMVLVSAMHITHCHAQLRPAATSGPAGWVSDRRRADSAYRCRPSV